MRERKSRLLRPVFFAGPFLASLAVLSACRSPEIQDQPPTSDNPVINSTSEASERQSPDSHVPIVDPTCSFYENELVVKFKRQEVSKNTFEILDRYDAKRIEYGGTVWLLAVDREKRDALELELTNDPNVELAIKNFFEQRSDLDAIRCPPVRISTD